MGFEHPWLLLALLGPLLGAVALRRRARQRGASRWPALKSVAIAGRRVLPSRVRPPRPALLLMLALAAVIVASARPQWGEQDEAAFTYTREVVIALDLSRSMVTEDLDGRARLDVAKTLAEQLLDGLRGESVALVVFAGTAFVQVPLGPDYQIIRAFLPSLDTDYLPQGGSDYARMLDAALDGFSSTADRDRYLVVLSDGESSTTGWEGRLGELARRDVHAIAIGVGTVEGGFIRDYREGGYLRNADGDVVQSRLMPATLEALARRTNGRYVEATALADADAVKGLLEETVATGRKGRSLGAPAMLAAERFQWFLLPAVLFGAYALYRELPPRPGPRRVRPASTTPVRVEPLRRAAALVAALLLVAGLTGGPTVRAHFDDYAEFEVRQVFDSDPVQRLRAIVAHLAEFGYDAFDLRLMVEETIRYGVDSQRTGATITEGVLRDAIEATRRGERLDTKIADWTYYRVQLEDMLKARGLPVDEPSQAPRTIMDEENDTPIVIGDGSQQLANDSFGVGASARTDATLGEMTPPQDLDLPRGRRPPPPQNARFAGVRAGRGSGETGAVNPVLDFARERLDEAAKADSPGRLHVMMAEDAAPPARGAMDW